MSFHLAIAVIVSALGGWPASLPGWWARSAAPSCVRTGDALPVRQGSPSEDVSGLKVQRPEVGVTVGSIRFCQRFPRCRLSLELRHYDPWGNYTSGTPTTPLTPGYTGHLFDTNSGLIYGKARWYAPELGRWTSEDPVGPEGRLETPNALAAWGYADGNPLRYTDPTGEGAAEVMNGLSEGVWQRTAWRHWVWRTFRVRCCKHGDHDSNRLCTRHPHERKRDPANQSSQGNGKGTGGMPIIPTPTARTIKTVLTMNSVFI